MTSCKDGNAGRYGNACKSVRIVMLVMLVGTLMPVRMVMLVGMVMPVMLVMLVGMVMPVRMVMLVILVDR